MREKFRVPEVFLPLGVKDPRYPQSIKVLTNTSEAVNLNYLVNCLTGWII